MTKKLYEIWKEEPRWDKQGQWKLQMTDRILTFTRKRDAVAFRDEFKRVEVK